MTRTNAIVVVALFGIALVPYALAAQEADSVATNTGCLKNGELESLAVGTARAVRRGADAGAPERGLNTNRLRDVRKPRGSQGGRQDAVPESVPT
jgi:hypothetical protein